MKKKLKKLKEAKDALSKVNPNDAFEKLVAAKQEVKTFVLTAIKVEDFMFTDLFDPDPTRGIFGAEEIKARISDFLVEAGIRDQDDVKLIFPPDDQGSCMEPIEVLESFQDKEVQSDENDEI